MKELLVRGSGFISSHLPEHEYIPREWLDIPETKCAIYTASYGNYYDQEDIYEIYKANLTEAIRLLKSDKYQSMILISSSSVLLPKQTFYSLAKKSMEEMAMLYAEKFGKKIVIVRPSSVTGPGEQPHHLIPKLIDSCMNGTEIPFVGDPTHDFIDVRDFCDEVMHIVDNIDMYSGKVLNLSSGVNYSNQQVLEAVEEVTGTKANIKTVNSLRDYDTKEWFVEDSLPYFKKRTLKESIKDITMKSI